MLMSGQMLCDIVEILVCGPVAQLGARFHGMEEVVSSNLTRSTKLNSNSNTTDILRRSRCTPKKGGNPNPKNG